MIDSTPGVDHPHSFHFSLSEFTRMFYEIMTPKYLCENVWEGTDLNDKGRILNVPGFLITHLTTVMTAFAANASSNIL